MLGAPKIGVLRIEDVYGWYTGQFIRQVFGYKVISGFKHRGLQLFGTSVSEAFSTEGTKNLYKVNILWPKNVFSETRCIFLQCLIHHCD